MAGKRRWVMWPGRFVKELNGTSGLAGAGGTVLAVLAFAGLTAASGPVAVVAGGAGILIAGVALAAAGAKSIPPRLINPADVVGRDGPLGQLDSLSPKVFCVGIVGPGKAGKSTLASQILHQPTPGTASRTLGMHCYVAALQTAPVAFVAIVDGPGDRFAAQFEVVEHSQIVFVILDHSDSGGPTEDEARIGEHRRFQKQLRDYLVQKEKKLDWVHLLLNKRDLWQTAPNPNLVPFLNEQTYEWQKSNLSWSVTSAMHSNELAGDISLLLSEIIKFLGSHRPA